MNYQAHYDRLIDRARSRILDGYCEWHHIVPRCMHGSDDPTNLVSLTPEEHYVAHLLLVKIHPNNRKLLGAAMMMTGKYNPLTPGRNNKSYGWLRRRFAASQKGIKRSAETRRRLSESHKGKPLSEKQIAAARARRGRPITQEKRDQMARARLTCLTPDRGAKISAGKKGKRQTDAHRAALGAIRRGKRFSAERNAKISASLKGRKKSPAHCAAFSARMKGNVLSPETREKIAATLRQNNIDKHARIQSGVALVRKIQQRFKARMLQCEEHLKTTAQ